MNTQTHTPPHDDRGLSQAESKLLSDALKQKGAQIQSALVFWKLRPSAIARSFKDYMDLAQILKAIRREETK